MSHIDEGELTAYADGAYAPEDADAQRIAAHIAECANCRNRLLQAQMLSGRASEILAVASPVSVDAPSFEEIAANATPRRRARLMPLQWAASIILAVGLGWFGRDALYQDEPRLQMSPARTDSEIAPQAAQPAETPLPSAREEDAGTGRGARAVAERASANEAQAFDQRAEPAVRREARAADAIAGDAIAADVIATAPPPAAPPAPAPLAAAQAAAESSSKSVSTPSQRMATTEMSKVENDAEQIEYITAAEAETRKLTFHIVPELEVLRIGLLGSDIRVEQKLPDGKIVTVETGRPAVYREKPVAGAAPKQPAEQISVMRGESRVTISGPLGADSLRALAAKIR